ncbi:MAG: MarR family winged helix-turn-helix transcriptional regulator [Planctomycetota bacterium]
MDGQARDDDPLHGYAGFLLGRAYQSTRSLLDRLLVEHDLEGVTPGMGPIFYHLFEHDACPLRDIVRRTGLDKATVTNQIAAMQRAGLVRRSRSQGDRRCVLVHLTARGRELAGPASELLVHLEATLRAPFDSQRWQRFAADLRAVIAAAECG